ncbi:hypothetical protein GCM10010441_29750 [Kitasatospora paracochleata]|uniref:Alpha/beta hydrolase family protein DUF900 n=1 Tax=Kitasatospora paracochleata TaxID=58354 RepID=A0ABT1JA40_9ACTN|nr:hypothetical protein [Kitasatospora paracochleata]MCP2313933.1 hypothetical protein [Kitasatospora paracochleata]
MSDQAYIVITGRNGQLDRRDSASVDDIVAAVRSGHDLVVHLHGGLVNEASGLRTARRLTPEYLDAGASPVFVVWQSGLLEVLCHNLDEIFREEIFKRMLKWVLQFTVGKLWQGPGERAAGALPVPNDIKVKTELARRAKDQEPFDEALQEPGLTEVSDAERRELESAIESDPDLLAELEQVLTARHPETTTEGSRGVVLRREGSSATLMDPDALDEVDTRASGDRGIVTTLALARKCGQVLVRVISRCRAQTDHGIYPTVVEELLRAFYLANAGGAVWSAMKKETSDTFASAHDRFGRLLLDGLSGALASGSRPRITLVGHSTGAVYIDNLLAEVARGRTEGDRVWPDDTRFQVVFLAPACTYDHFTVALDKGGGLIKDLRMFTMDDATEASDRLVGPLYPRSLLYFVSGVLERNARGASACVPLLGMARYREAAYQTVVALGPGRKYLTAERVVLSPSAEGSPPGRQAGARSHTSFDDDSLVLGSIATMIRGA